MTVLLVAVGAAVGAPLRYALARLDGAFPAGMLAVNAIGSGLFGLFAAMSLGEASWALLGTGFCGAFTSFSSFAVQTVERPARRARPDRQHGRRDDVRRGEAGWCLGTAAS